MSDSAAFASQDSHRHHYVAQWYQRRFLHPDQSKYYYLDLHPERVNKEGHSYRRTALLHRGPAKCFYEKDLYTIAIGDWATDEMETKFFREVDFAGMKAVHFFAKYRTDTDGARRFFNPLNMLMDAQRFRTPRGLEQFRLLVLAPERNATLLAMQKLFRFHVTMWGEAVWEIVRARQSRIKFIVSDEPVSFYNRRIFPSESIYPGQIELDRVGTRTIFPLGLDSCLILTHRQFARNPWGNPLTIRENARSYAQSLMNFTQIQVDRELEENEVLRVNHILKNRATRFIAAAEKRWLYPEDEVGRTEWSKIDNDWFLLPNLYKIPFLRESILGFRDGGSIIQDEYGRDPAHPKFKDNKLRKKEEITHREARREWAKRRAGKSIAHINNVGQSDQRADSQMYREVNSK